MTIVYDLVEDEEINVREDSPEEALTLVYMRKHGIDSAEENRIREKIKAGRYVMYLDRYSVDRKADDEQQEAVDLISKGVNIG